MVYCSTWSLAFSVGVQIAHGWKRDQERMHGVKIDRLEIRVEQTADPNGQPAWVPIARGYVGDKIYFEAMVAYSGPWP